MLLQPQEVAVLLVFHQELDKQELLEHRTQLEPDLELKLHCQLALTAQQDQEQLQVPQHKLKTLQLVALVLLQELLPTLIKEVLLVQVLAQALQVLSDLIHQALLKPKQMSMLLQEIATQLQVHLLKLGQQPIQDNHQ